jgi:Flp pilus assembly protein TadB
MVVLFGVAVFCAVIAASFAFKSCREKNSVVQRFKTLKTTRQRMSAKDFIAHMWEVDRPSAAIPLDNAFVFGTGGAGAAFLFSFLMFGLVPAFLAGLLAFAGLPVIMNAYAKAKRIKTFKSDLEPALDILTGCLSAGMPFAAALSETARTAPPGAARDELDYAYRQISEFNSTPEKAFSMMALRVPCREMEELRDAMVLYQRIGGPEALKLLRSVIANMRKASAAKHEIDQKKKSTRMTAMLVGGGPIVYVIGMMFVSPDMLRTLVGTGMGRGCLILATILFAGAVVWLRAIFQGVEEF